MILYVVLLRPKPETSEQEVRQKIAGISEVVVGQDHHVTNHKGYRLSSFR
ncbi:hypothetical protein [Thermogemmatispora carboxidivorans]|nr:hypothetical protein [Thermogemmatispora carboxidivorans]